MQGSAWSIQSSLSLSLSLALSLSLSLSLSLFLSLPLFLSVSLSFTLDLSPGYSRLIRLFLSPFSGMQRENCIVVLNELGGQCWPQHQLTQLLITALIGAADGESPCDPEYKCPAETRRCTRACTHAACWNTRVRLYGRGYVFLSRTALSVPSSSPYLSPTLLLLSLTPGPVS